MSGFILPVCLIVTTLCFFQSIYGIAQYFKFLPAFEGHRVTGSFDNPAGFAASLCAGFPFFFYFIAKKEGWKRWSAILAMLIVCFTVILSGSRAGMLALAVVCVLYFLHFLKINVKQKIIALIILLTFIPCLYFLKKDSADGRLLIWKCSWEMIKEKPFAGHGTGGFKAGYMNYQAKYFEENPDSKYAMLAGNINRPFNEYIGLLVNYGLLGFLFFSTVVFFLFRTYQSNKNKSSMFYISYYCLAAIAVFSLFSYPLRYPFVWVAGLLSCSIVFINSELIKYILLKIKYLSIIILIFSPLVCLKAFNQMSAEIKWREIAHKSLAGQTEQMLPIYQSLYSKLHNNELFLYNYTAELNFARQYKESLIIAKKCERLWADYDLQILMADNYLQLKNYKEAERYYKRAATMCPVKFVPLYKLAKLYKTTEHKESALNLAKLIINKEIKVRSSIIDKIITEMLHLVETLEDT